MPQNKKLKKALLIASVPVLILLGKILIWDSEDRRWLLEDLYYRPEQDAKLTIAPEVNQISQPGQALHPVQLNDASKLEPTQVAGVFEPRTVAELKVLIEQARSSGKKISLSGSRHSMGGQIAYPDSLHLDMRKFDQIHYNPHEQSVTVQSGATWRQIQQALGPQKRAIRVMQDSNLFTVGGSLSSNVHGKDPRFGTLIESVLSFKLLKADGSEVLCSRQQNPELFRSAIGGMGLFGIITEVVLKTTPNSSYAYTVVQKPQAEMIPFMEAQSRRSGLELIEAQMSIDRKNLLAESQVYYFDKIPDDPSLKDDVSTENSIWLRKLIFRLSRNSDQGKQLRWAVQKNLGAQLDPDKIIRNSAMAAPFRMLQLAKADSTDVLQEYFVPTAQATEFLGKFADLVRKHDMQLLNLTVRKMPKDTEALVSYATSDMYAFVCYYRLSTGADGKAQMTGFTREMMDLLLAYQGTFYLTYRGYYTRQQIHKMYPRLAELFKIKLKYDPQELFVNKWYQEFK